MANVVVTYGNGDSKKGSVRMKPLSAPQWHKFTNPPKEGQLILVPVWVPENDEDLFAPRDKPAEWNHLKIMRYFSAAVEGKLYSRWIEAESITEAPQAYDPHFGDNRLCLCGHPYYRHFDTYEDMYPIGCNCHGFEEGINHRMEEQPPEELTDEEWSIWWIEHDPPSSICTGFKLDVSTEPELKSVPDLWGDFKI